MPNFQEVVRECLANGDFVAEVDRLCGTSIAGLSKRTPLEIQIDEATGYADEQMRKFCSVVFDLVWTRCQKENGPVSTN